MNESICVANIAPFIYAMISSNPAQLWYFSTHICTLSYIKCFTFS